MEGREWVGKGEVTKWLGLAEGGRGVKGGPEGCLQWKGDGEGQGRW